MFEPAPPDEPAPAAPLQPADRPIYFQTPSQPGNGAAVTSLILGILGVVVIILSLGVGFLFSLPLSIAAWITGSRGRKRVAKGETKTGDGLAHAGLVLGIVGVILATIGAVVWIALIASGLDPDELQRDIERWSNPDADQALWTAASALLGR